MPLREKLLAHRIAARSVQMLLRSSRRRANRPAPVPGPIRIVLSNAYADGGTMRAVLNLAHRLSQRHDVEIISVVRTVDRPFYPLPPGRVIVLDDRRPGVRRPLSQRVLGRLPSALIHLDDAAYAAFTLWTDIRLLRLVRRMRSGVLIATRPGFALFAARFAPPEVVVIAQQHTHLGALVNDLPADVARYYGRLDAVAVLTRADERAYGRLLAGSTRVLRIPNALPTIPGKPAEDREPVILAAGRLVHDKGFDLLIRAFAPVAAQHPDWRLVIHGDGWRRDKLAQLIDELGLGGRAVLAGPTSRLGETMARSAIFALSSRTEGFSLALVEAMSKGMAVVSFDCPTGPREILTSGHDGLLLPPEDVDSLSRALLLLIDDEELRRRLGAAAIETTRRYGMDAIGAQWETVLDELGGVPRDRGTARFRREPVKSA